MPPPSLLQRLKERKLVQWALAYLAGAWVIYEGTGTALEAWDIPVAAVRAVHVLLVVGFLLTLVLAWYHGEKGRQKVGGVELLLVATLLVVAGVALTRIGGEGDGTDSTAERATAPTEDSGRIRIALLPFEDLSPNSGDAFFAAGVNAELRDKLAQISALEVIAGSSVERFRVRNERPSMPEISEALDGVDYIVDGNARVGGGQVRILVQIMDAMTGHDISSNSFDSPYRPEEVISLQAELARQITAELEVEIAPDEEVRLAAHHTDDEIAFQLYLQARAAQERGLSPGIDWGALTEADRLLQDAITLDPDFALAHATLSALHGRFYFLGRDRSQSRLSAQREAAEEAIRLQPNLPQARFAMGYVHYVNKDYQKALEEFDQGLEGMPSEATIQMYVAAAQRRLGQWTEAVASARRAISQSPLRADWYGDILGLTLWASRRYAEASTAHARALTLSPGLWKTAFNKGRIHLAWEGTIDTLRAAVTRTPGMPLE
jgi:serine/threonine-protein kinase